MWQVINRIVVGPRPVHMFAVPETLEVWAHSDAAGTFDVISIDDTNKLNATVAVRSVQRQYISCTSTAAESSADNTGGM